jgi:hypothetical protein
MSANPDNADSIVVRALRPALCSYCDDVSLKIKKMNALDGHTTFQYLSFEPDFDPSWFSFKSIVKKS